MFVYLELFLANSINNYFDCCPKSIRGILSCTKNPMLKGRGPMAILGLILSSQTEVSSLMRCVWPNSFRIATLVKSVTLLTV